MATLDFTDQHYYWDHPSMFHPVTVQNRPLLAESPLQPSGWQRGSTSVLAAAKVAGKPFFCTEWGFPYPNQYRCEGPLLLAAYACLQDWDGITATHYSQQTVRPPEGALRGPFVIYNDPLTFGQFPAAALLFHRHDVAAARRLVQVAFSRVDAFNCQPWHSLPSRFLPYISREESCFFDERYSGSPDVVVSSGLSATGDYAAAARRLVYSNNPWCDLRNRVRANPEPLDAPALYERFQSRASEWGLGELQQEAGRLRSDNGQLTLEFARRFLSIDTARTQGAVGFLAGARVELRDVVIECQTEFCAVTVSSLDDAPVGTSRRCLITAVARAENTGQLWNSAQTKLLDPGKAPILVEPVCATVTFKGTRRLAAHALDATGAPGPEVPSRAVADGVALTLGPACRTCFFAVEAQ